MERPFFSLATGRSRHMYVINCSLSIAVMNKTTILRDAGDRRREGEREELSIL